jgi:hypothetical protein
MQMGASRSCAGTMNMLHCARTWADDPEKKEVGRMPKKTEIEKMSIYIPQNKISEKPVERLIKLGAKRDRSVNYLVVEAILQYLQREEASEEKK